MVLIISSPTKVSRCKTDFRLLYHDIVDEREYIAKLRKTMINSIYIFPHGHNVVVELADGSNDLRLLASIEIREIKCSAVS